MDNSRRHVAPPSPPYNFDRNLKRGTVDEARQASAALGQAGTTFLDNGDTEQLAKQGALEEAGKNAQYAAMGRN